MTRKRWTMLIAKFIGRTPTMIVSGLVAVLGVVLIVIGVTASPVGVGGIVTGLALIVVAALLILDARNSPR